MVIQAVKSLPKTNTYSFIALEDLFNKNDLKKYYILILKILGLNY